MKLEDKKYYLIKNSLFGTEDSYVRQYEADRHVFLDGTFVYGRAQDYTILGVCKIEYITENANEKV